MPAEELGFALLRLQGPVSALPCHCRACQQRPVIHRLQTSIVAQYRQVITTWQVAGEPGG